MTDDDQPRTASSDNDDVRQVPESTSPDPVVASPPDANPESQALASERDKYLRLAAEFDNFRKRNIRERQEAGWRAQADLVAGLLESLDDIMRFAHLDPAAVDSATVVQGVAMVEKKIFKVLDGHGLELIDPLGRVFDPALHEAIATDRAASVEEDHIVGQVYQPGYVFRGLLLRPARVVVKQFPA